MRIKNLFRKILSTGIIFYFLLGLFPYYGLGASLERSFFTNQDYDENGASSIEAQLIKTTNKFYFYVQKDWYLKLDSNQRQSLESKLNEISNIFEYQFYPQITSLLTTEDIPGIDNDPRLIVVLEKLKTDVGGYVRSIDGLSKSLNPTSNEGQIIFLNAEAVLKNSTSVVLYYLSHEFTHLITLKARPKIDVWLAELFSEFAATILKNDFSSSLTKKRASQLLTATNLNFLNWQEKGSDYGKIYLLALYLKEQFSQDIFKDILFGPEDSVSAIESALKKRDSNLDIDELFLRFLIINVLNDCSIDKKYCYQDENLKNFSALSNSYFLPQTGESTMTVVDSLLKWEGKWQKIQGGNGLLKLKFILDEKTPIKKIPYILIDENGQKSLNFIDFSKTNIQEITVLNFGSQYQALIFIPYLGKDAQENKVYYYSWEAKILANNPLNEEKIKQELLKQIEFLKKQVALLQQQLAYLLTLKQKPICLGFSQDLYYGMNSEEVKCLQIFLKNLGPEIYPEGLITGYYGPLTMAAVKRYQALKGILATGYFGPLTRTQVNKELSINN